MNSFDASAPAGDYFKHSGITADAVTAKYKEMISKRNA